MSRNPSKTSGDRRAAIYKRISQDREGRELGVTRQDQDCRKLAARLGVTVVADYCDNDLSASPRSRKPRPQYDQLHRDARTGRFDVVLSYTTGRLTRRPRQHEDLIDLAIECGIEYQFVSSPAFDLNTAAGRRVARILAASDAGEIEEAAERIERAKLQSAQAGEFRGAPRSFGYADGRTVEPGEAQALAWAAAQVLSGRSMRSIGAELADDGWCKTGTRRCRHCGGTRRGCADRGDHRFESKPPARMDGPALRRVLLRPRVAGLVEYHGDVMLDPDTGEPVRAEWPGILSVEMWQAVRAVLLEPGRRTTPGPRRRHQGSGVYLCGVCGDGTTVRTWGGGGSRRSQPRSTISYQCRNGAHLARRVELVDEVVDAAVVARLSAPDAAELLVDADAPDLAELNREAMSLRRRIAEAGDMWESGEITRAERKIRVARLEDRLADVEARMRSVSPDTGLAELVYADDVAAAWSAEPVERRNAIILALMTVTLHPAKKGRPRGWRPGQPYFDPDSVQISPPSR